MIRSVAATGPTFRILRYGRAMTARSAPTPEISIVVPVFNEAGAVETLALEISTAFAGWRHEMVFVDDASGDDTRARLTALSGRLPGLRVMGHRRNAGQSRAIRTGVLAARAPLVVTLDGDGQNAPADAPRLAAALRDAGPEVAMIAGERRKRQDSQAKKWASRVANGVRRRMLRDKAADTGCGLKAFRREAFLALPYFDHLHRYLPALMLREGFEVRFEPVGHRPRESGQSKYTNLGRLGVALFDLAGVMWLNARARPTGGVEEATLPAPPERA